jgi:ferredoxin--NADP+ reductase
MPELIGLAGLFDVDVLVDNGGDPIKVDSPKTELLAMLAERTPRGGMPRIVLRFRSAPVGIIGEDQVRALRVARTDLATDDDGSLRAVLTDDVCELETQIVLNATGYRAQPIEGLPFDPAIGRVPNDGGRVEPGVYVSGWIKRGATGFIGTNRSCAEETVSRLLADLEAGLLKPPASVPRSLEAVDLTGWRAIDRAERAAGRAAGRPRVKLTGRDELVAIAQRR